MRTYRTDLISVVRFYWCVQTDWDHRPKFDPPIITFFTPSFHG